MVFTVHAEREEAVRTAKSSRWQQRGAEMKASIRMKKEQASSTGRRSRVRRVQSHMNPPINAADRHRHTSVSQMGNWLIRKGVKSGTRYHSGREPVMHWCYVSCRERLEDERRGAVGICRFPEPCISPKEIRGRGRAAAATMFDSRVTQTLKLTL